MSKLPAIAKTLLLASAGAALVSCSTGPVDTMTISVFNSRNIPMLACVDAWHDEPAGLDKVLDALGWPPGYSSFGELYVESPASSGTDIRGLKAKDKIFLHGKSECLPLTLKVEWTRDNQPHSKDVTLDKWEGEFFRCFLYLSEDGEVDIELCKPESAEDITKAKQMREAEVYTPR